MNLEFGFQFDQNLEIELSNPITKLQGVGNPSLQDRLRMILIGNFTTSHTSALTRHQNGCKKFLPPTGRTLLLSPHRTPQYPQKRFSAYV